MCHLVSQICCRLKKLSKKGVEVKYSFRIIILLVGAVLLVGGCTKPSPDPLFPTREQLYAKELESLRDVAELEATAVSDTIAINDYLDTVPIFVSLPDQTNFSQYYRQFLITALVNKGYRVSETQEDLLVLSFTLKDRILLTTQLSFDNKYLMRDSRVYFAGPPTLSKEAADAVWQQYTRRKPAYIR